MIVRGTHEVVISQPLDPFHAYAYGFIGSIAAEVVAGLKECSDLKGKCPVRYKRFPYLLFRTLLASVAGIIPIAMEASTMLTALYLGASAPVFFDRLSQGVSPPRP